jgi:hypothetical protein
MDLRTKLSQRKARSLEQFLKTLDRFDLMPPYLVTLEMKPKTVLNRWSNIEFEEPQRVYGIVIRIMTQEGICWRITIDEEDEAAEE